ncbi:putative glycerol-3-phosphate acyltransferase PlsX [Anopheles sinensis]|uniref:Putative glycerol-3-phosphate acyltransferase PlsX n=1 Tax=Anopheles sinensis TaxID=74873 RepID=A0A084VGX4_ANOSI|nr:putative glycerol-3-phosphate acyltransferase PlsX [Anopheles sinensis]
MRNTLSTSLVSSGVDPDVNPNIAKKRINHKCAHDRFCPATSYKRYHSGVEEPWRHGRGVHVLWSYPNCILPPE